MADAGKIKQNKRIVKTHLKNLPKTPKPLQFETLQIINKNVGRLFKPTTQKIERFVESGAQTWQDGRTAGRDGRYL